MTIRVAGFAPAKINLFLHVTGKRDDGYHLLDSLVAFADIGDRLTASPAPDLSLDLTGPFAAQLEPNSDNLVLRAARWAADELNVGAGAAFVLEKNLPVASGLGGGSSDAATAMQLARRLWNVSTPLDHARIATKLGADVPVCLARRPMRMMGIGEILEPVDGLPAAFVILANPGVPLSTAAIFKRLRVSNPLPAPVLPKTMATAEQLAAFLQTTENALSTAAIELVPAIETVLARMRELPGCALARMCGSGPTCFGLFAAAEAAYSGAAELAARNPPWWVQAGQLGAFPDTNP